MSKQIFRTALGQSVDLGTIKLKNEHVRAVGNMNVNARGDTINNANEVIETKNRQIQRQNNQLTVAVSSTVHTSSAAARRARRDQQDDSTDDTSVEVAPVEPLAVQPEPVIDAIPAQQEPAVEEMADEPAQEAEAPVVAPQPLAKPIAGGGLAAAIARSRTIKQEKEKTLRQQQQDTPGIRKI
jgi:hypothetical protein